MSDDTPRDSLEPLPGPSGEIQWDRMRDQDYLDQVAPGDERKPQSQTDEIMPQSQDKHPLKSKTVWGLLATLLGGVCMALGWPADSFQFIADGIQLADIGAIISLLGFLWSQYGQRVAKVGVKTVSGKERVQ